MKHKLFFTLITIAMISSNSYGQETNSIKSEKQAAARETVTRLEQIYGGVIITRRCEYLSGNEYIEYDNKAKALASLALKMVGEKATNLQFQRAKLGTNTAPYNECNEESKLFFESSKKLINNLYETLSQKES